MQPGWLQLKDSHTLALTFGIDCQSGSHGRSLYWTKTRRMGHRRGKWGSRQCGPLGRHIEKTSQGNKSQNGIQHQWGVTRPQLILALVSAYIRRTRSTFPSSGCLMSTLMLVKWFWCGCQKSCSETYFFRQKSRRWAPESGGWPGVVFLGVPARFWMHPHPSDSVHTRGHVCRISHTPNWTVHLYLSPYPANLGCGEGIKEEGGHIPSWAHPTLSQVWGISLMSPTPPLIVQCQGSHLIQDGGQPV